MDVKKIGLAADHAGYAMKEVIKRHLADVAPQVELVDFGTDSAGSCDYPDYAHRLGSAFGSKELEWGIAVCGSANGISMALNKHAGVRAAICWRKDIAELARQHNDANVVSIPGRFVSEEEAKEIIDAFFATDFEGGRHQRRVDKINL